MNGLLTPIIEYARRLEGGQYRPWRRAAGKRFDLHCHSTFSDERIKWLPRIVYHPLLTPEQVYDQAKQRGMDFVTITDHDTIDGCLDLLNRRGPLSDFVIGEEVSARFPEDGTIVHINVFDHDEAQHRELQRLRSNIYELVAYLRTIDKLYVINHLTWTAQHRVLKPWQIETMLELFDVFEGLNGARSYAHNAFAWYVTRGRKVLVAGSDSHTHRVGTTYTLTEGAAARDALANIRAGRAAMCGAFGTAEKFAEDVWLVMQGEIDRRLEATRTAWARTGYRVGQGVGRAVYRGVCVGYNFRQDWLMRGFVRGLPAMAPSPFASA